MAGRNRTAADGGARTERVTVWLSPAELARIDAAIVRDGAAGPNARARWAYAVLLLAASDIDEGEE